MVSFAANAQVPWDTSDLNRTNVPIVDAGELKYNRDVRVVIWFQLTKSGYVAGTPHVTGKGRNTKVVEKAKKRALAAVLRAQPFKLPPEEYESWRNVTLTFYPFDP